MLGVVLGLLAGCIIVFGREALGRTQSNRWAACASRSRRWPDMCGIAGVLATHGHAPFSGVEMAARMNRCLAHRGPDDSGLWQSSDGRGCARTLEVVHHRPLAAGPQSDVVGRPALDYVQRGDLELSRDQAGSRAARSRVQTDTEVILAAYDQWGLDAASRLAGMFAFGLWDEDRRRLWIVAAIAWARSRSTTPSMGDSFDSRRS